jgi:hypothetical protein
MIETKQYPRFINRIDYIIRSIVGDQPQQEVVEPKKEPPTPPKK